MSDPRNIDITMQDDSEDDLDELIPSWEKYSSLSDDSSSDDDDDSSIYSSLSSDSDDSLEVTRKKELERDRYKRELYEFYSVHNPAKIEIIDKILDTFAGREDKLLKEYLPRKYNKKKKGEKKPWHGGEWDDIVNVIESDLPSGQVAFVGPDGIPGIGTEIKVPRHKRMWRKAQEKIRKWNPMKRNRRTRVAPMPQEGGIRKKRRKTRRKKRNRKKSTRRRKRRGGVTSGEIVYIKWSDGKYYKTEFLKEKDGWIQVKFINKKGKTYGKSWWFEKTNVATEDEVEVAKILVSNDIGNADDGERKKTKKRKRKKKTRKYKKRKKRK